MPWTIASAYPSSELSAGQFAAIAITAFGGLAAWLILVYLAARPAHQRPHTGAIARDRDSSDAGHPAPTAASQPEPNGHEAYGEVASSGHIPAR